MVSSNKAFYIHYTWVGRIMITRGGEFPILVTFCKDNTVARITRTTHLFNQSFNVYFDGKIFLWRNVQTRSRKIPSFCHLSRQCYLQSFNNASVLVLCLVTCPKANKCSFFAIAFWKQRFCRKRSVPWRFNLSCSKLLDNSAVIPSIGQTITC